MLKTGNISSIVPCGGYNSQNGYINTFTMTVDFPDGQKIGEIGAKSAQYPLAPGQPITVEVTNSDHGLKFKKVNPGYGNQGGNQGSQNPPQRSPQPARDYDKENRGKCATQIVKAYVSAGNLPTSLFADQNELNAIKLLSMWLTTDMPLGNPQARQFEQTYDLPPADDIPPF